MYVCSNATWLLLYMCMMQDGRTPLMHACLRGKEKIVTLLIEHGADVLAIDKVTDLQYMLLCAHLALYHCYSWQKGESCLNFDGTLRNLVILEMVLKEYRAHGASVDVESFVSLSIY